MSKSTELFDCPCSDWSTDTAASSNELCPSIFEVQSPNREQLFSYKLFNNNSREIETTQMRNETYSVRIAVILALRYSFGRSKWVKYWYKTETCLSQRSGNWTTMLWRETTKSFWLAQISWSSFLLRQVAWYCEKLPGVVSGEWCRLPWLLLSNVSICKLAI